MPWLLPANPSVGQTSTQNGRTYVWSGSAWTLSAGSGTIAPGDIGAAPSDSPTFTGIATFGGTSGGGSVNVSRAITGGVERSGIHQLGVVSADVTTNARGFHNRAATADNVTLAAYSHYFAGQGDLGAGSSIQYQYGFVAAASIAGATNNVGFLGDIQAAASNWNVFCPGPAQNYFAGNVGIGLGRSAPATALDVNGVITVAAGSDTAPAISPTGDTNTGIYFANADTVGIATGGLARLTVQSGGNIVIGQDNSATALSQSQLIRTANGSGTNVAGADLRLQPGRGTGTAAGGAVRFLTTPAGATSSSTLNVAVERLTIAPDGNVGIGTSSPSARLDVSGDSIRVRTAQTPGSASAAGDVGTIAWDGNYLYVCVSSGAWKRAALTTW